MVTQEGSVARATPFAIDGSDPVLRGAMRLTAVVVPVTASALFALARITEAGGLVAWALAGAVLSAFALVQVALDRTDIRALVLLTAVVIAVAAPSAPPTTVTPVVAAAALVGLVLFMVLERTPLTLAAGVIAVVLHVVTLVLVNDDWAGFAGAGVLLIGVVTTWTILDRIVARMRVEHASYRQLFDRVPVGLYRTALSGELLDVNPALANLMGLPPDQLIGRRAQEFFVDVADFTRLRATIGDSQEPVTTDIRFRRIDGTIIWIRDQTRPVLDEHGRIVCFEGELQDVTAQRRHVEELEALVRSKSELIGAVSHELRTPLTAVVGFLELLQSDEVDDRAELLALAADQARDVAAIVDDLLTAARLENHELVIQESELDVRHAVDGAVASVVGTERSGIEIDVPEGLTVWADAARVRQIVRNLVSNAVRYGEPPVTIRAVARTETVELSVSDRGSEIPAEVSGRMFDAFFSGASDSPSRQPGSIGLGLAVSQRLARLMGGSLDYERVADETRFTLVLPESLVPAALADTA